MAVETKRGISLSEYHSLIDRGFFGDTFPAEFIEGVLIPMSPRGEGHDDTIQMLADLFYAAVDRTRFQIRIQSGLTLADSEPEPDFYVWPVGGPKPFHPGTAELVIEVSVTSLHHDLRVKAPLYARNGILEYWVVDLIGGRVVVHRQPGEDGYADVRDVAKGELSAVGVTVDVAALLAA